MSPVSPESSPAAPGHGPVSAASGSQAAPSTARRVAGLLVLACATGAVWLLRRLAGFEYGLDQGIYASVADVMLQGGAPYRDAWDFKPPGVFLVYATAKGLLGDTMQAVRVLEALLWLSLAPAFMLFSRRFVASVWPGLLGFALAACSHVWMGFWHTGQPESFGAVLLGWALVLATVDEQHPRKFAASVGAAALYACAALLKPPLGGGILVSFAFALRAAGSWRRPTLAYAIGGATPVLLTLAVFAGAGALDDLHEALFVFAPQYTALNYQSSDLPSFVVRTFRILFLRFSWLNPLGLALLLLLPRMAPRERSGALHVAGVLGFCLLGVALQGRFFAYHYGAALPLLSLLAGWGLFKLVGLGERFGLGVAALALAVFLLANSNGVGGSVRGSFLERVRTLEPGHAYNAPLRRVAAWLRARTAPGDPIHVFGFQPVLYDLADRPPASRFLYNAPQRAPWYSARGRDALMQDLRATPPAAILVERDDVHPGTAGTGFDSATTLTRFPRLAAFLRRDYDAGEEVGRFTIHLRRPERDRRAPAPPPDTGSGPGSPDPAASP